jgi:hypothetical protein
MEHDDAQDRLIEFLLREELGKESPPNLAERVMRAADKATRRRAPVSVSRWKIPALIAATVALAVLTGLGIVKYRNRVEEPGVVALETIPRGEVMNTGAEAKTVQLGVNGYCRVDLSPKTQVIHKGVERAEELYLTRGMVQCEVDKKVGTFAVQSSVGTVTVTGTKFTVKVPEAKGGTNMSVKKMLVRVITGAVVLSGAFGELSLAADQEGGAVTGMVTSKGDTWIAVKAEGSDEATMYMPYWRGGQPKDGGSFDKETLAKVKSVEVGSKVRLAWKMEEHPRITNIDVLSAPEKHVEVASAHREGGEREKVREGGEREKVRDGDKPHEGEKRRVAEGEGEKRKMADGEGEKRRVAEGEGEKRKMADGEKRGEGDKRPGDKPKHEEGGEKSLVGVVTAKGEVWIEVKAKEDGEAMKFFPKAPTERREGEKFDRDVLRAFQKVKVGEWVKIDYIRGDEHYRAQKVQLAPK